MHTFVFRLKYETLFSETKLAIERKFLFFFFFIFLILNELVLSLKKASFGFWKCLVDQGKQGIMRKKKEK